MAKIDTTVTGLQKLADQSKAVRSRFEPVWYLNMAYYVGDQWVYWNNGRLDKPRLPRNRLTLVDNRIMPVIATRTAKKTKQRPIWTVTPNSAEDVDIDAAMLGEFVMEERWKTLSMQEKLLEALLWADICCAGFWKIYWDNTKGNKVDYVMEGDQPMQDQMGRPMRADALPAQLLQQAQTKTIAQGDVCLEVRSPFELFPDPLASSMHEAEWIIEEVVQSEEYVKSKHGKDMEGDTDSAPGPAEGRSFSSGQSGASSAYKGIKVSEFWAKSSSQFPKGKRVVWAKNTILYEGDNPYDGLPYVMFQGSPVPGRFWPSSITEQLRGPQTELNKIRSQIAENAQRIGNPSLLKDRNSNIEYSGVPGEELLYDGMMANAVPSYLQPPEMPTYVREQIDRIENSIREISGQHEVTSSQVPAGVTAASAINLLLEQDDTRLGPTISDMEHQLSLSGQMVLKLIGQYYTDERVMRLAGEDGDWDIRGFKGEMLKNNTAVEVQAGSAMPVSKAAKQAAMQQTLTLFVQNGVPLEPKTMRKFFRDFEAGGLEHLFADLTEGIRQVKRENRYMFDGQPMPINTYDDDDLHVSEHEEIMRGSRFFKANPQIKQIFEGHVSLHRDRRMQAKEAEAKAQMDQAIQMAAVQNQGASQQLQMKGQLDAQKGQMDQAKGVQDLHNKSEAHQMAMVEGQQQISHEMLRFQQEMRTKQADFEAQMKLKQIDATNRRQGRNQQ